MSDDRQLANPNPLPGLTHDFGCTHERVLCRCYAHELLEVRAEVARLTEERDATRAELRAQITDWEGAWRREHARFLDAKRRYETSEAVLSDLMNDGLTTAISEMARWDAEAWEVRWRALRQRLQERFTMAREVLEQEGLGHVAALIPIEEVLIWMDELAAAPERETP